MKITKLIHSCLLVEMPAPVNRTALFDPGVMSEAAIDVGSLVFLDNIIITHNHADHMSLPLIRQLADKFPDVRITATVEVCAQLKEAGIEAVSEETPGITLFESPHADVEPLFQVPQQRGVHYLDLLTDPGDSHDFHETKPVLALPVTAPWGSTVQAVKTALELKPKYIIPVHDWHYSDAARKQMYEILEKAFAAHDITFLKPETGVAIVLNI
ncbi:MAG TPA: MBL fold metallo-hydrolase [Candidatus Saccharimonadales bacterium]|jgi:L-ascorbate metabolism protein UlaG (beta-lactamase superfamily)